jgi:hypothetical protein
MAATEEAFFLAGGASDYRAFCPSRALAASAKSRDIRAPAFFDQYVRQLLQEWQTVTLVISPTCAQCSLIKSLLISHTGLRSAGTGSIVAELFRAVRNFTEQGKSP